MALGLQEQAEAFESAVGRSTAVICRPLEEALRLARSDDQAYATFYQLLHAGARLPNDGKWDRLRALADDELFGMAKEKVRHAALTLNGAGLPHYGDVSLEFADHMIAHRATAFEENSAVFFERARKAGEEPPTTEGYLSLWNERGKLALAKHASELAATSDSGGFQDILLRAGPTSAEDVFVEVHIYGSLSRRSLKRVLVRGGGRRQLASLVQDLRDRLDAVGVEVVELEDE